MSVETPNRVHALCIVEVTADDAATLVRQAGFADIDIAAGVVTLTLDEPIAEEDFNPQITGLNGTNVIGSAQWLTPTTFAVYALGADDANFIPCIYSVSVFRIPDQGVPRVAPTVFASPPTVNPGAVSSGYHAACNVLNDAGTYYLQGGSGFVGGEIAGGERIIVLELTVPLAWNRRSVVFAPYSITPPGAEFAEAYVEICDPAFSPVDQARYIVIRNSASFVYEMFLHVAVFQLPAVADIVMPVV